MEKFVLKYNGNGFLYLKSLDVTFKKGYVIDMVSRTGISVEKLECNPEICKYLDKELSIVNVKKNKKEESITIIKESKDNDLHKKIDILLGSLNSNAIKNMVSEALRDGNFSTKNNIDRKDVEENEDEEIRKNLLKELVFNKQKEKKANLKGFGKREEKIDANESDGLDDIIDF